MTSKNEYQVSNPDNNELYVFDSTGYEHKETRNLITGTIMYKFLYDTYKNLVSITDQFNNRLTFESTSDYSTQVCIHFK